LTRKKKSFFFSMGFFFFFPLIITRDLHHTGQVSNCDITPDYGCPPNLYVIEDGKPNRLKCKDASRIMAWVTEPVLEARLVHSVCRHDETKPVTTYTPGARIMINLRVKQYNQQYRGLLMYAHSTTSNVTKVGDWDFVDRTTMFHSWCPQVGAPFGRRAQAVPHAVGVHRAPEGHWHHHVCRAPQDRRRQRGRVLLPQQAHAHRGHHRCARRPGSAPPCRASRATRSAPPTAA
jgi:hypothetical protein